ncbi:MAG: amidohydrolase [Thermomicrobiales bacterium]|nr:amidohydrolase [Thermomicrobiales bacterium]
MTDTFHQQIATLIDEIEPGLIADRRHLHQHPELSFQEYETAEFVRQRLEQLGVEDIRTGVGKTGVTGVIRGTAPGNGGNVLLRADMDALPIVEETPVEFASCNPGVMHACGHDAHTAILLSAARVLSDSRDRFAGTVTLCFQPAEEVPPGGGIGMINDGVLEGVDAVLALHMAAAMPTGTVAIAPGPVMAGGDLFRITFQGKGGHAASPELASDPIVAAAATIAGFQSVVSRNIDPMDRAVLTVGSFSAGEAFNVIPDTAVIAGTYRYFSEDTGKRIEQRLTEIATDTARGLGCEAIVEIIRGYHPTVNDDDMAELARLALVDALGDGAVKTAEPVMGGEDFSHMLRAKPGAYFVVGCYSEVDGVNYGHHHPKFDVDEDSLAIGVKSLVSIALRWLEQNKEV